MNIYTCQGRNNPNVNTIMYFNSLTLYNYILFNNSYEYILLIFEWRSAATCNQIIVVQIFSVLSENTVVKQYASNNLSRIHSENLLTELCLTLLVIVGKYRWE